MDEENLTFEDGIVCCKYLYQCAIHKTLNGVPEEWAIFYKTHDALEKLGYEFNEKELQDVLYKMNVDSLYNEM